MRLLNNIIIIIMPLMLLFASCEERYMPDLDGKYQSVLVVDGMISNAEPPYKVKLSLSTSIIGSQYIALQGYEVKIIDDSGNEEVLSEAEPGTYVSSANGIKGEIGRSYKIALKSPQGKTYESEYEKINIPVGIESVYQQLEYMISDESQNNVPGYQFYINTEIAQNDSSWLLWQLYETYQYESDYLIYFTYNGTLNEFHNSDSLKTCWKTEKVFPFFVESTIGLSEPRVTEYPLHFVSTETRRLSIRYSLLVNQYSINKEAYTFWNSIKEQNTGSGDLYSTQPYLVKGNVSNVEDEDELVLGYFMAAGVSEQRIFVNRPDPTIAMYYPVCELSQSDYEDYGWMFLGPPPANTLYITRGTSNRNALPNQDCIDCRRKGGKLEKPDFWIDK